MVCFVYRSLSCPTVFQEKAEFQLCKRFYCPTKVAQAGRLSGQVWYGCGTVVVYSIGLVNFENKNKQYKGIHILVTGYESHSENDDDDDLVT